MGHHRHTGTPREDCKCAGIVLADLSNPVTLRHHTILSVGSLTGGEPRADLCPMLHLRNSNVNSRERARLSNQANSERVLMR